ncbi:Cmx/CmrA family chloramphenicol efflux MFS transporter [Nonomuraea sp. NPDC050383]|uniref:Cmx/CmrA family chloramphenicol efflux MFS transporter n=1 Tax=Nonomuraea sp. NPDC050383 TaxID=3364362 RepID=UPI0037AE3F6F
MPFALYLLGLAVFAMGTSEFMLSGLVPDIASDMNVSVPAAGALTSAFAAGMIVGAPLMAVLSLRWPRRRALLVFLLSFLLLHVLGAVTTGFEVLLVTRFAAAVANAGFLAVAVATAAALAPPAAKGRATSILLGGVTLACVAGVPAGALLGQLWGWRSAFWAVALLSAPAVVAVLRSVPAAAARTETVVAGAGGSPAGGGRPAAARREARALRDPRLLVLLLLAALVNGATFCTFTYLAPLATTVSGIAPAWMPVLLVLFGLGSFAGVTVSGRLADSRPRLLMTAGGAALVVGWAVFATAAGRPAAVPVLVFTQGALSFAVGSTLVSQVLYAAPGAPTLAGSFATAAFNVGAAAGPWLGGVTIGAGLGYRSPLWVSAALVALALAVAATAHALERVRAGRVPAPRTGVAEER